MAAARSRALAKLIQTGDIEMFNTFLHRRRPAVLVWLFRWAVGLGLTALEFVFIYSALLEGE